MQKVTLQKVGGSLGVELPDELLERMQVAEGDDLCIVESEDGVTLTRCEPDLERAMRFYQEGARKYRNALRELAQ
jgi:putative addiction module antidote